MGPVGLGLAIADRIVQGAAPGGGAIKTDDKAQGVGFSDVLLDVANSTARSVRLGEEKGVAGILGKASARDVVDHLMRAEQDLQVALAVRDKAIAAFQEISRMAI